MPARVRELVVHAARLRGRSVSEFVVSAAEEAARRTIEEEAVFRVSIEDQCCLVAALRSARAAHSGAASGDWAERKTHRARVTAPFRLEPLGKHDRKSFRCGNVELDTYLQTRASQDVKRHLAACYVLVEVDTQRVAGFFTLSAASIPIYELSEPERQKLGRYPAVPAARIGRLATSVAFQGQGVGTSLLVKALAYAAASPVACFAALVDAKDETAARFYERHGFIRFASRPLALFIPVATFQTAPSLPKR